MHLPVDLLLDNSILYSPSFLIVIGVDMCSALTIDIEIRYGRL